jgi:hypothetical protein
VKVRLIILAFVLLCSAGLAHAAGGTCPANAVVTGNNCYFIAATGNDSNNGTSESTPWFHAPGMPNCSSVCASTLPASPSNGNTNAAGLGFIFRGGDTWHFGITSDSSGQPASGGSWGWRWGGSPSTCVYEGTLTGCAYLGVDTTWYNSSVCAGAWCRPKFNADNPLSTSIVSSCTYQTGSYNVLLALKLGSNNFQWDDYVDSFEFLGLCGATSQNSTSFINGVINDQNGAGSSLVYQFFNNIYIHGWTTTSLVSTDSTVCVLLEGAGNSLWNVTKLIIDGSDSVPADCVWTHTIVPYHFKDSYITNVADGVASLCHDIHDNIFDHIASVTSGGHTNVLECNSDAGDPSKQSLLNQTTPNVWYNNIIRHTNSNVMFWNCPNATVAEFYWGNLFYDSAGEGWSIAGPPIYPTCLQSGGQAMFNNTFVDGVSGGWTAVCNVPTNAQTVIVVNSSGVSENPATGSGSSGSTTISVNGRIQPDPTTFYTGYPYTITSGPQLVVGNSITFTGVTAAGNNGTFTILALSNGGKYLTVLNEHLINTAWDGGTTTQCAGGPSSATNISQTDAQATAQGYTTGSAGSQLSNTCANEATTPCAPTATSNATVGAGANEQAYCTTLATYSGEYAIGTEAANACKFGTTDGCSYNGSTHMVTCPAETAVTRPTVTAWDAGAYQKLRQLLAPLNLSLSAH